MIRFMWAECVPEAEIHLRLSEQYRNSDLLQRSVKPCSKTTAQVSLIRSDQDAHPHTMQRKTASE
jgi:hypothetical protein